jgi:hypothetical protein
MVGSALSGQRGTLDGESFLDADIVAELVEDLAGMGWVDLEAEAATIELFDGADVTSGEPS